MPSKDRVLVLGASSWLGYLLLKELKSSNLNYEIAGTTHKQKSELGFELPLYVVSNEQLLKDALNTFQPTVVVNFLRGEDANGMGIHKAVIDYCEINGSYYLYASSVLALDGYEGISLTEKLPANSISDYGNFKASCEKELSASSIKWCAIRFASVQGYVPHKITRNEAFLRKLMSKETIVVDKGVFQNRLSASLIISGISKIIALKTEEIIHFGTIDSSEEFVFLQQQARLFGYSPKQVIPGTQRDVNLVAVPNRIFSILGNEFKVTEQDTLKDLLNIPELQKYRR